MTNQPLLQEDAGKGNCTECPADHTTAGTGSTSFQDCVALVECRPGWYSGTGHEPCTECPRDTYSQDDGLKECTLCPADHTTAGTGSTSFQDCVALVECRPGWYSGTGHEPCTECPRDTYSQDNGVKECTLCPGGQQTASAGAASAGECRVENIAPRGRARQSGVTWGGQPGKAVDGDMVQSCVAVKCSHTSFMTHPWWSLDLQKVG